MWRDIKLAIGKRAHRPSTVAEMKEALLEEWDKKLPLDKINKYIANQSKRVGQVIEDEGNNTFHGYISLFLHFFLYFVC